MINLGSEDDDHLLLLKRSKHQKGKCAPQPSEPANEPESKTSFQEESGVEKGAIALMDRVQKLKEKTGAYISQFISDGSQFKFELARPVVDRLTPPSLALPTETLEEERSSDIVHAGLARLQRLLKRTSLDHARIVKHVKLLEVEWPKLYASPQPADLEQLVSRLQALVQRLEGGLSSEDEACSVL
jgi:hypothetical protein